MLRFQEIERRSYELMALAIREFHEFKWNLEGKFPKTIQCKPYETISLEGEINTSEDCYLRVLISGTALLYLDGKVKQSIDPAHTIVNIEKGHHLLKLFASPRGLFGENGWEFNIFSSHVFKMDLKVLLLGQLLLELSKIASYLSNDLREEIKTTLSRSLEIIDKRPSISQISALYYLTYKPYKIFWADHEFSELKWDLTYLARTYSEAIKRNIIEDLEVETLDEKEISEIEEAVIRCLEKIYGKSKKEIFLFSHAHLDAAWLWPYSETRRKNLRTFANLLDLSKGYEFTHAQSSAQYFEWLEYDDSDIFKEIEKEVAKAAILIVGGMWVESDTNMITGLSLARQFYYGQKYFMEKFKKKAKIGWLPDSFGFSAQLPQIMLKSGIEVFVTHKPRWNDMNEFPYNLFKWIGLDGSEIVSVILPIGYEGKLSLNEIKSLLEKKEDLIVHAYGAGDGGSGPNFLMAERLKIYEKSFKSNFHYKFKENEFISKIKNIELPIWRGEIYLEKHRGIYTSNLKIKKLISELENILRISEILCSIKHKENEKIDEIWKILLRNEFHDIISGSANHEAYEEAYEELNKAIEDCRNLVLEEAKEIAEESQEYITVFNPNSWQVESFVEIEKEGNFEDLSGNAILTQPLFSEKSLIKENKILAKLSIPPLGFKVFKKKIKGNCKDSDLAYFEKEEGIILENSLLKIFIKNNGELEILDKQKNLSFKSVLKMHQDKPAEWDAWDLELSSFLKEYDLKIIGKPYLSNKGPLFLSSELMAKFKNSEIIFKISLFSNSKIIEVRSLIDWKDKGYLLKNWLKPSFKCEGYFAEIPFGYIKRLGYLGDSFEKAKFEAPALRWAALDCKNCFIAFISDSMHGYSFFNNSLGLSLLKSPIFPNPWSDLGLQNLKYYIMISDNLIDIIKKSYELYSLYVLDGLKIIKNEFLKLEGDFIILESIKPIKDGLFLLLYNPNDKPSKTRLGFENVCDIFECDLLGESKYKIKKDKEIVFEFKPFEIKGLIISKIFKNDNFN